MPGPAEVSPVLLVDAHVHFYPCFRLNDFLDAALTNLGLAASSRTIAHWTGCLMLTERARDRWFAQWRADAERGIPASGWSLRPGADGITLIAERGGSARLVLVAGRQMTAPGGLEVLALACDREFPPNLGFDQALDAALHSGGLAVLPWGFGKWMGARGRQVRRAVEAADPDRLFLGDNGGRSRIGPYPKLLRWGRDRGFRILPGSDPLPFPKEVERIGSFGFVHYGPVRLDRAGSELRSSLATGREALEVHGAPGSLGHFVVTQSRLQWGRRVRRAAQAP